MAALNAPGAMLSFSLFARPGAPCQMARCKPMVLLAKSRRSFTPASEASWNVTYSYDPLGRRIYTDSSQYADTAYVHAGDMEIAELDSAGHVLRRYIPGAGVDQRVAMITEDGAGIETGRFYYYVNRLGSVIALINGEAGKKMIQRIIFLPNDTLTVKPLPWPSPTIINPLD